MFFGVFCNFFLFQIIYNWKTYFINYKLQTNKMDKKKLLPTTLPVALVIENQLLLPNFSTYSYFPPTQRLNHIKCQIVLVFKTFPNSCHFPLYILFFLIVYWNFLLFLIFVISLIKDFHVNDSDLLELHIYLLNIKSQWFCNKSSFESTFRKPKKAACGVRSNKVKSFSKNKARPFH